MKLDLGAPPVDFAALPDDALIRMHRLMETGLIPFSKSTLHRFIKEGKFPQPLKISVQVAVWRVGDIREWLKNPPTIN